MWGHGLPNSTLFRDSHLLWSWSSWLDMDITTFHLSPCLEEQILYSNQTSLHACFRKSTFSSSSNSFLYLECSFMPTSPPIRIFPNLKNLMHIHILCVWIFSIPARELSSLSALARPCIVEQSLSVLYFLVLGLWTCVSRLDYKLLGPQFIYLLHPLQRKCLQVNPSQQTFIVLGDAISGLLVMGNNKCRYSSELL